MAPTPTHTGDGLDQSPLRLKEGELGWIGTGSVGFPTNPERRAEFLILDDSNASEWKVEKYEVPYPRETARARLREVYGDVCGREVVEQISLALALRLRGSIAKMCNGHERVPVSKR
jgi:hypothetical protein